MGSTSFFGFSYPNLLVFLKKIIVGGGNRTTVNVIVRVSYLVKGLEI